MLSSKKFRSLKTRMVRQAAKEAPKRKRCPKCSRVRNINLFGFRTQHDRKTGKPIRSLTQSYCKPCRRPSQEAG